MPCIVAANPKTTCSKCVGLLETEALKCSRCSLYMHLQCSDLPMYMLLRLKTSQSKYICRACVLGEGDPESLKIAQQEIEALMTLEEQTTKAAAMEESFQSIQNEKDENKDKIEGDSIPQKKEKTSTKAPTDADNQTPICKYYVRRECRHGRSGKNCNYRHPRICPAFSRNGDKRGGCSKGEKCKDLHPKTCYESMQKKECSRKSCRFYHLNGTKQTYDPEFVTGSMPKDKRDVPMQPVQILQRDKVSSNRLGQTQRESLPQTMGNNYASINTNTDPNFLAMEQKIQRIETMISAILQSVRPPTLMGRHLDH